MCFNSHLLIYIRNPRTSYTTGHPYPPIHDSCSCSCERINASVPQLRQSKQQRTQVLPNQRLTINVVPDTVTTVTTTTTVPTFFHVFSATARPPSVASLAAIISGLPVLTVLPHSVVVVNNEPPVHAYDRCSRASP